MIKNWYKIAIILLGLLSLNSCESYLDQEPDSTLSIEEVFKNFQNSQGFIDELYMYVTDYGFGGNWQTFYMIGDEADGRTTYLMEAFMDQGNYTAWENNNFNYFNKNSYSTSNYNNTKNAFNRPGVWQMWRGIRKANIAIENAEKLMAGSQYELDLILGQAYFFRAYFHAELMKFWGRIPYIDKVLSPDEDWSNYPRPENYKASALKADADFARAAALLPYTWPSQYSKSELIRATKGAAFAFKGKNLLLAGSPLMKNDRSATPPNTYDYDKELCQQAASDFAQVINAGTYSLAPWSSYTDVFFLPKDGNQAWPAMENEYIFNSPSMSLYNSRQLASYTALIDYGWSGSGAHMMCPTHNFVHRNFGMANGHPCTDVPSSGFDVTKPWEGRDPRLNLWVTVNGEQLVQNFANVPEGDKYAQFYEGGHHRYPGTNFDNVATNTGYVCKKFYPLRFNKYDKYNNFATSIIHMRYTDVILMYAEALFAANENRKTKGEAIYGVYGNLSAEDAINVLRDRVAESGTTMAHVPETFNGHAFMDEIRRERSVELSFEGKRWNDIRRWGLAHLDIYKQKTEVKFDANYTYFDESVIVERVSEYPKHFWLPFPKSETQIFEGFDQNPGW